MSFHFPASFPGRCGVCGEIYGPGDEVYFSMPEDILTGWECCGEADEPRAEREKVPVPVMPRGKTAKDKCPRCFQVPASNGVCGCD
jgi:hypothetical protein